MNPRDADPFPRVPVEIEDAAAEWLGRRDGGLAAAEEIEFAAWLAADPRHEAALARLEAASTALDQLEFLRPTEGRPDPDLALLPGTEAPRTKTSQSPGTANRRRRGLRIAVPLAIAACLAVIFAGYSLRDNSPAAARFAETAATEVGGLRRLALPDGSIVELNTNSAVEIGYDAKTRAVTLARGEAHFVVAKDAARPFVVRAGGVNVAAVGTAFNIRLRSEDVDVLVTEGRVRLVDAERGSSLLSSSAPAAEPPVLSAGYRARVPTAALAQNTSATSVKITPVANLEMSRILAWQAKRLEFEPTPLREVVAEFNRYNSHQLVLGDTEAGSISIGGSFAVGDYDMLVRLLEASFNVAADRQANRTTLRLRR